MTASTVDQDIWHVMLASDDMKRMNVDQLDDAFRLSVVDSSTMVWKAGMQSWRRLGSIAGIDDEPTATPLNPFTMSTPVFSSPQLLAPVYERPRPAPDPYVMPRRRVALPSEVDFRRSSRGVRWGRWLVALTLLSAGLGTAYQQQWLRAGAQKIGIEGRYLATDHRLRAFVAAKTPAGLANAFSRFALTPQPAALLAKPAPAAARVAPSEPAPAPASQAPQAPSTPELQTVSLDSLPVLSNEPAPERQAAQRAVAPTPRGKAQAKSAAEPERAAAPRSRAAEPSAPAEPDVKVARAMPPPADDNPLKAAIRKAIAADAAKHK